MKRYRGPDGKERIWFESYEIEHAMEDELIKAGLYPTAEQPVFEVEQLLEVHLRVRLDQHAHLEKAILGVTTFTPGDKPLVEINRDLSDAVYEQDGNVSVLGRWRATLAHESAHVILHRPEFLPATIQASFLEQNELRENLVIKCFKRNVGFSKGQTDWREFQANRGMAALLMPGQLINNVAQQVLASSPNIKPEEGTKEAAVLAAAISDMFHVSRQAATIRLSETGNIVLAGQSQMTVN